MVYGTQPPLLTADACVRVRKGQVKALPPLVLFSLQCCQLGGQEGGSPALGEVSINLSGFFSCIFFLSCISAITMLAR